MNTSFQSETRSYINICQNRYVQIFQFHFGICSNTVFCVVGFSTLHRIKQTS